MRWSPSRVIRWLEREPAAAVPFAVPLTIAFLVGVVAHPVLCASLRSEEHTSELQSHLNIVCRLLLAKKHIAVRILCHTRFLHVCLIDGHLVQPDLPSWLARLR